jgi:hypothetical protein
VGASLAPEENGWLDFSALGYGLSGSLLGGLIGAAGGYQIGKNLTVKVTLVCGP